MAEKCFCHLNGYKVKDADARQMQIALQTQLNELTEYVRTLEERIAMLESIVTALNTEV